MSEPHRRLSEETTDALQEMIFNKYQKGDKIPTEEELTKIFSVSRITIRTAVANLKSKGILEVKQGDGTYVKELTPSSYMQPILPMLKLNNADLEEIFEVRILIESQAAKQAASKGVSEEDISKLNDLIEKMNQQAIDKDIFGYNKTDLEFHKMLVNCSKNEVLSTIHELLLDLVEESIQKACIYPEHLMDSIIYHNRILKAITSHYDIEAGQTMENHLSHGLDFIKKKKQGAEALQK